MDILSTFWNYFRFALSLVFGCLTLISCEDKPIQIPQGALTEQTVDIQGKWQVQRAWLNVEEITDLFDFQQIVLTLQMSEVPTEYQIVTGTAPFPILEGGKWAFNDLAYPTSMQLTSTDKQTSIDFASPPISGDATFTVSFSLGCPDNLYTYEFHKIQ